ncbi:nuclear transport factor 2 family protein [Nocardia zapadnayensis]|uniref:nuclear transport factor 2 family protein n=1 Tax=Nocardia rhamnosiphila TaxID=426716 RepID=UPI0022457CC2|nr:nuclear transport factor 2 family protein [Nocardia zapadnayensis]MCX0272877.1 nuclear transport factor 2 family protein [Nocardia zapadnayensis]
MSDAARLARLEAQWEIGQLPIRYALAVDRRDIDTWTQLFVPDVDLGRHGSGRAALKAYIEPQVRWFYRSAHLICGHRIELGPEGSDGPVRARGSVYCRAEHEVGDRWIVMAIRYDDDYRRVDGEWLFERRREHHWYAADITEHPQAVGFDSWGTAGRRPALPSIDPEWGTFWAGDDTGALTADPVGTYDRHPRRADSSPERVPMERREV